MRAFRLIGLGPLLLAVLLLVAPVPPSRADESPQRQVAPSQTRDPRFGIVQAIHAPDLAVEAGASWERIIFPWSVIEAQPGQWKPGFFTDRQIRDQVNRGFTEVGVLIYTPTWASADPKQARPSNVPRNLNRPWNDPENYWGRFTWQMAKHYQGQVDHWVIWNEPDLYDPSGRWFFNGSFEEYYQLVKVAYQAIKSANPRATVILGGFAYTLDQSYGRPPYLASFLEVAARDPTARANNFYFDVVDVHTYANPLNSYAVPMIMRQILQSRGLSQPIWIMESNAVPGDDPRVPVGPTSLRASQEEQASYVIQSFALGIAAGVERQSIYKMIDETAEDGQVFGLARNDGSVRPAYRAYQVAATYLRDARWASYTWSGAPQPPGPADVDRLLRSNEGRGQFIWPGQVNRVVVERDDRRTTVVWNASPQPITARVAAAAPSAVAVTQTGNVGEVVARDGQYTLDLPPTAHNPDPNDPGAYLIGGRPWILEELVTPLPRRARTRVALVWPHGSAPVDQAEQVNVTAYVLGDDGATPVPCRWEPLVLLWASIDEGFRQVVGLGHRELTTVEVPRSPASAPADGATPPETVKVQLPIWQFENVQVGPARGGSSITFSVTVDGVETVQDPWIYGGPKPSPFKLLPPPAASCR